MAQISNIPDIERNFRENVTRMDQEIEALEQKSKDVDRKNREAIKSVRTELFTAKTNRNSYIASNDINIANLILDELYRYEQLKNDAGFVPDSHCETIRQLYLILSNHGRINARYVKLPRGWMNLGYYCGLLEDMVVVTRTLSQVNISKHQLVSLKELIDGFRAYVEEEKRTMSGHRFTFLTDILSRPGVDIQTVFRKAIHFQGASKRIGISTENEIDYYYAIQGIYGLEYDSRVTRPITVNDYLNGINVPRYAIHFTKREIARSIFDASPTSSHRKRANGKELIQGAICRFDRAIHAITNIEQTPNGFVISSKLKDIRDRMTHGISDTMSRQKYEAGLIFDISVLVNYYESMGVKDLVLLNELETLLVLDDIPHNCLVQLIETEEELNKFWRV